MIFRIATLIAILLAKQAIALNITDTNMHNKIIIWDTDGTITGSKDPNDKTLKAKIILPGVN